MLKPCSRVARVRARTRSEKGNLKSGRILYEDVVAFESRLHRGLRGVRAARDGRLEQGRVRVTAVLPRHCMTVDIEA